MTIPDEPVAQLKYLLELYRTGSIVSVEAMDCIVALLKYALDLVIKNMEPSRCVYCGPSIINVCSGGKYGWLSRKFRRATGL